MDDMIYDLENKIEMLKEQPEYAGFMKNRFVVYNTGNQRYGMFYNTHTSNGTYVPNSLFQREAIMKKIKDELSVTDYETLQYTTYESSKETIKKYIEILNHLFDKGIFDILEPKIPQCPNEMNDDGISSQFQLSDKVKLRVDHDLTEAPCEQSFDHDSAEMLEKYQLSRKKKKEELLDGQLTEAAKKCFWNVNEDTSLFKQLPCVTITFDHINGDPDKIKPLFDCPNGKLIFTGDDTCLTKEKIKFSVLIGDIYNRQRFMTKLLTTLIEDVKTSPNVSDDDHNGTDYTGPLMSIRFNNIDSFDVAKRIHDTFVGDRDYINNNILLTINESDVLVTICIDDIHSTPYDLDCKLIKAIVNTIPSVSE